MKKIILILCAFVSAICVSAKVGDIFTSGNITYKVTSENDNENEVAVQSPQSTETTAATIPSTVSYGNMTYDVTGIDHEAFSGCINLKTVSLPTSLTWIGAYAFNGCTSLTAVNIPSSVTCVGRQAFAGCSNLSKVTLNADIEWMGDDVFLGCSALKSFTLPPGFTKIGDGMFERCGFLATVDMEEGITVIGDYAFAGCELSEIIVPTGTESIGDGAFAFGSDLTAVAIPNSVEHVGNAAFLGCGGLTHVTLPSWLSSIGVGDEGGLIDGCDQITEITIPAYVENVGDIALHPAALTSIFIMGDRIPSGLSSLPVTNAKGEPITIYVKKSVFEEKYADGEWLGHPVSYRIPITMINAKGNGVRYKTLCRDFDIDLSETNIGLEEGTRKLSAYIAPDADEGLGIVFMEELNYIPSRVRANEEGYQGEDEYVGIVLKGTPGITYYYMMGENDYTQGIGQWLLEDATAAANSSPWNANLMQGAQDAKKVGPTEVDNGTGMTKKNFGLSNGAFHAYSSTGWIGYNKAYLSVPQGFSQANITMMFTDTDGTTESITLEEFTSQCDEGDTYDLSGRRVNNSHNGIVIQDGKKRVR